MWNGERSIRLLDTSVECRHKRPFYAQERQESSGQWEQLKIIHQLGGGGEYVYGQEALGTTPYVFVFRVVKVSS